jgi:2-oxoglutarate ferredoxin oxidoreductase subunit beta
MVTRADVKSKKAHISDLINKYLRPEHLPQIWCPGCGNGIIMRDIVQAIENLGLSRNDVIIVSGIGCAARSAGYMDFNTIHTTHGRAIAFATGIKLANPRLTVIVVAGDGDIAAIGGNHLIHAARRNVGMTVVVMNNDTYGMTGGQASPTTPKGKYGTTAPYGSLERSFDIASLAYGAGLLTPPGQRLSCAANHQPDSGRHPPQGLFDHRRGQHLPDLLRPQEQIRDAVEMLEWQRDHMVTVDKAAKMSPEELEGKLVLGLIHKTEYKEFTFAYDELIRSHYEEKDSHE